MQVYAELNNIRIAPRKVRTLISPLKGMNAILARHQLIYITKRSASPFAKLIDSALANAEHNFGLLRENLFIQSIIVNEGPKLKRFRPKGFGSSSPIEKKTSRIRVVLEEKVPGLRAKSQEATPKESSKTEEKVQVAEKKVVRAKKAKDNQ
jgi:large subunit ribosomal protein L22